DADPRTERGTGHRRKGGLSRASHFRESRLRGISPADAALRLPPLGRDRQSTGRPKASLGSPEPSEELQNATGRRAAGRSFDDIAVNARLEIGRMTGLALFCTDTVRQFARTLRDDSGATAIEYAMIAAGVGCAVAATVFSLGSSVKDQLFQKVLDAFN